LSEPITIEELKSKLTPQQRLAAQMLADNEFAGKKKKTLEQIAEEVGVTVRTLYEWRQNRYFILYQNTFADNRLESFQPVAISRLLGLIEHGASNNGIPPIKALDLYFKLTGKLVDKHEVVQQIDNDRKSRLSRAEIDKQLNKLDQYLQ
jgi:transcriptional regulator with XRE-family HTH domain